MKLASIAIRCSLGQKSSSQFFLFWQASIFRETATTASRQASTTATATTKPTTTTTSATAARRGNAHFTEMEILARKLQFVTYPDEGRGSTQSGAGECWAWTRGQIHQKRGEEVKRVLYWANQKLSYMGLSLTQAKPNQSLCVKEFIFEPHTYLGRSQADL